ncbi:hypothetical protein MPSEU_000466800 [Mayamaea pseudoterrestris]|nr:hypothetical protein MPSEU_000466800 [Mayamaea pseudoterrestris]
MVTTRAAKAAIDNAAAAVATMSTKQHPLPPTDATAIFDSSVDVEEDGNLSDETNEEEEEERQPPLLPSTAVDQRLVHDESDDINCHCYNCLKTSAETLEHNCKDLMKCNSSLKNDVAVLQATIAELETQQLPVVAASAEEHALQQSSTDETTALKAEIQLLKRAKHFSDLRKKDMEAKINKMRIKICDLEEQVNARAKWPSKTNVYIDDDVLDIPWKEVTLARGNPTRQISSPAARPRVDTSPSPLKKVVLHFIQAYLHVKNSRFSRLDLARIQPMTHENFRRFGVDYFKATLNSDIPEACTAQRLIHYLTSLLADAIRKSALPAQPAMKAMEAMDACTFFDEDQVHDFFKVMQASKEGAGIPWRQALEDEQAPASDEAWGEYVAHLFLCCFPLCEMCQNQSYDRISICQACTAERRMKASWELSRYGTAVRSILQNKNFRSGEDTVFRTMHDVVIPGSDEDLVFKAVVEVIAAIQLTNLKRLFTVAKGFAPDIPPKQQMGQLFPSVGEKKLKNRLLEVRGARAKVDEPTVETDQTLFALYKEAKNGKTLGYNSNKSVFRISDGDDSCVVAIFEKPTFMPSTDDWVEKAETEVRLAVRASDALEDAGHVDACLDKLGSCGAKVTRYGRCTDETTGQEVVIMAMEAGHPLDDWFDMVLRKLTDDEAILAAYNLFTGLCSVAFFLETVIGEIHNDLKPENIIMTVVKGTELWLTNKGTLDCIPAGAATQPKIIDFGSSVPDGIYTGLPLSSPEFDGIEKLLGMSTLWASAYDRFSLGRILVIVANQGVDPWQLSVGDTMHCPPELREFFYKAIDFDRINGKDVEVLVINLVYRYIVFMDTDDHWVAKQLIKDSPNLSGLDKELATNETFKNHVDLMSLTKGSFTQCVRYSPIFKCKEAAIMAFFGLMDPSPSNRLPPEEVMKFLKDR